MRTHGQLLVGRQPILDRAEQICGYGLLFRDSKGPSRTSSIPHPLVNSVALRSRQRISTVNHAIAMLGRQQMRRWIQLALFGGSDQLGLDDPLLDAAAVRAGFMEQLARRHPTLRREREAPDEAFMIGILSLIDSLYDTSMEELVHELHLSPQSTDALLRREGVFGHLLAFVERTERSPFSEAWESSGDLGLDLEQVIEAQAHAFAWRAPMTNG